MNLNLHEIATLLGEFIPLIIIAWVAWVAWRDHRDSMRNLDELHQQIMSLDYQVRSLSHSPSPSHAYYDNDEPPISPSASGSPSPTASASISISPSPSEEPDDYPDSHPRLYTYPTSGFTRVDKPKPSRPACTHCRMPIPKDTSLCPYCGAPQQ